MKMGGLIVAAKCCSVIVVVIAGISTATAALHYTSSMVGGASVWFKQQGDWLLQHEIDGEAKNLGPTQIALDELLPTGLGCMSGLFPTWCPTTPPGLAHPDAAEAAPQAADVALNIDWRNPPRLAPQIPMGHPLYRPAYLHPQRQSQEAQQQKPPRSKMRRPHAIAIPPEVPPASAQPMAFQASIGRSCITNGGSEGQTVLTLSRPTARAGRLSRAT